LKMQQLLCLHKISKNLILAYYKILVVKMWLNIHKIFEVKGRKFLS